MERTKEQKQAYMKQLRSSWQETKKLLSAEKISEIQAIIVNHGMNISAMGFFFVSIQMKKQGFDGLPYLDAKTYKGWKQNGFQVKRGSKSVLSGITWISVGGRKDETGTDGILDDSDSYLFPKEYHLFHRSQVDAA